MFVPIPLKKEGEATIEYEGDITKTLEQDQVVLIKAEER